MTNGAEESFTQAIRLVSARVTNDTEGVSRLLDGLDREQTERLVRALAAAFAQYGVEASGGPEEFLTVLDAMQARY